MTSTAVTLPPRSRSKKWRIDDSVTVGAVRYVIRIIVGRRVELEAMNTVNVGIWWKTTLDNLPEKVTA